MNAAAAAIDPELAAAGALLRERGLLTLNPATAPLSEARAALARVSAFLNEGSLPLADERNLCIRESGHDIPCRLYRPDGKSRPPLLIYAHGGSFALGDLDGWDGALRSLVRQSGVAILHVDYRLAPEHRFPAAFDDMVAVIRHVSRIGDALDIDSQRLAAGGDSGGARRPHFLANSAGRGDRQPRPPGANKKSRTEGIMANSATSDDLLALYDRAPLDLRYWMIFGLLAVGIRATSER